MDNELQDANLIAPGGTVTTVRVPHFPANPELVKTQDGRLFVANSPAIGYGTTALAYHEVSVYEA